MSVLSRLYLQSLLEGADGQQSKIRQLICVPDEVHVDQLLDLNRFANHAFDHIGEQLRLVNAMRHFLDDNSHDFKLLALFSNFEYLLSIRWCSFLS